MAASEKKGKQMAGKRGVSLRSVLGRTFARRRAGDGLADGVRTLKASAGVIGSGERQDLRADLIYVPGLDAPETC